MREVIEFRIPENHAATWLHDNEGIRLGIARKYELDLADPRISTVAEAQQSFRKQGSGFFTSWIIRRYYSKQELNSAQLFRLRINSVFEPAGEECGTRYDELSACASCGAGAKQVGPLFLDVRRIPKSKGHQPNDWR
jgi:hypothetical protein